MTEPVREPAESAVPETGRPLAVVIVTYNSADVVRDCLRSLPAGLEGAGTYSVLVVDNASSDGTVAAVREESTDVKIIASAVNGGFAAGVNTGIAAAGGCDVLVLNPDTRLHPGSVGRLRRGAAPPSVGIVVPRLEGVDGEVQLSLRRSPRVLRALGEAVLGGSLAGRFAPLGEVVTDLGVYRRPGTADWATGAAWLVTRECLDAIGVLDERYFLYSEETEFMLRAGDAGFEIRFEPDARILHIGGEQSTSPRLWAMAAANRVRLHRERHGVVAAAGMRLAVGAGETARGVLRRGGRRAVHRAAVRELALMRPWPAQLDSPVDSGGEITYVCFAGQDWWYHNQSHSDFQLMRSLAEERRVLVVNSIGLRMPTPGRSSQPARRVLRKLRSVARLVRRPVPGLPGFHVMSPLPLPLYGSSTGRRINAALVRAQVRLALRALRFRNPVVVVTLPTAWDVVKPMRRRALVFNRSDQHSSFPESDQATIASMEVNLLRGADHILYVSESLLADERSETGERAYFLDHGVDVEHFSPRPHNELPADLASISGPRIGFFGALDDYLVDFDLLEHIAAELPEMSLVLIGDATHPLDRLTRYPNVHALGFRPYAQIPSYGSGFDVAIMPWHDNDWIRNANPIKLKEYLALGLPIVSTDFAELAKYRDRVRVATDPTAFVDAIRRSVASGGLQSPQDLRSSVMTSSWSSRAAELIKVVEPGL